MNDLAGQRKFQPGSLLEDMVTRDVPMFLEKPARLRTWVQGRGGLWEGENPGIVSKSEYSVVKTPDTARRLGRHRVPKQDSAQEDGKGKRFYLSSSHPYRPAQTWILWVSNITKVL